MTLVDTEFLPVLSVLSVVFSFLLLHSVMYKAVRSSSIVTSKRNILLSSLLSFSRVSLQRTSVYSLTISLIRVNVIFYAVSNLLLNNLFASNTSVYNITHVFSYLIILEFLWFLKAKDKENINQISNFLPVAFLCFVYIAISKLSMNLGIEVNSMLLTIGSYAYNWQILNIPMIIIPIVLCLSMVEQRIVIARKNLFHKTVDGIVDVITEKLIYFYFVILFIKSVFGGIKDLSGYDYLANETVLSAIVLFLKYMLIALVVNFSMRFKSIVKEKSSHKRLSGLVAILLFVNLFLCVYLRKLL
ncbi:hypothetical protein [Halobacteriovorax sp. HLS]|uniref:hypothetical protein n=1 Tax=Halobacteriovorax sp. HLS TaxID=2234000 RepID=UPI000FDAADD9|nr:hypothetical protein [Halobacteriovorax sp. HLS]